MMMILVLYLRLSKEDGDMADESNSIINQRYVLRNYVNQREELKQFEIREYIDDGYSGKNFERPGIKRLLEDVKAGKVYGIIVKDFSRFGRNYIEVGNYIEKIFPLLDIRFIAVNNEYDSNEYLGETPDLSVAFQNIVYDYFSEESSIKIKNDLLEKRLRGNYMASFATYGYKKSPLNHNHLIIDHEAASTVRTIFQKYLECGIKAEVARYLNDNNIPTPQEYIKEKQGIRHWKYEKEKKFWSGAIVGRILSNPVYIGNTVFHKKEAEEVGSRKQRQFSQADWITCEGTHEGIVTKELFEQVNSNSFRVKKRESDTGKVTGKYDFTKYCEGEKRRRGSKESPIKGFIKCGGCKHRMTRRNRMNASYYCRHYYEVKDEECCSENIKEDELIEIVRNAICSQAMLVADAANLKKLQDEIMVKKQLDIGKRKKYLEDKIQSCDEKNFELYEKYRAGTITADAFKAQKQRLLENRTEYMGELKQYGNENEIMEKGGDEIFSAYGGKENVSGLTRAVVEQLISEIYVYNKNKIEIRFKYAEEIEKLLCV